MARLSNPQPEAPSRRRFIVSLGRMGLHGIAAAGLWQLWPGAHALAAPDPVRAVPPMDTAVPAGLETATFGLG